MPPDWLAKLPNVVPPVLALPPNVDEFEPKVAPPLPKVEEELLPKVGALLPNVAPDPNDAPEPKAGAAPNAGGLPKDGAAPNAAAEIIFGKMVIKFVQ